MPTFTNGGAIAFVWAAIAIGMFLFWLIDGWAHHDADDLPDQDHEPHGLDAIESDLLWAELDHWNNRHPYDWNTEGL